MKSSNIGGQAVLEGIMMKHGDDYAVAVRKPNGEIVVEKDTYHSVIKWKKLTQIPFVRGAFNFIDSMVLGIKTLTFSASFFEEEEVVLTKEEAEKFAKQQAKKPTQTYQPQRRLVLDENGNFVTSDVFESAKNYKPQAEESAPQTPPAPPQDAPAPQLWWRRTGEETLIIDRKDDGYRVKEIRPAKKADESTEK